MADFGVEKVSGVSEAGESLTGDMDFFTVRTLVDITAGAIDDATQIDLDLLVETISTRAQPVILGSVSTEAAPDYTDFEGFSAGTIFVLKFATEHRDAWGALSGNNVVDELNDALDGVGSFIFAATNNVIVNKADNL